MLDVAGAAACTGDEDMTAATEIRLTEPADAVHGDVGSWAMVLFCCTEAALFAYLLASYFYLGVHNAEWPPAGVGAPSLPKPLLMTVCLVSSSIVLAFADRARARGRSDTYRIGVLGTIALGIGYLAIMALEYREKLEFMTPQSGAYASTFYLTTGFHGTHVLLGLLILAWTLAADVRHRLVGEPPVAVANASLYWHFVDGVWLVILTCLYLSPRWY